jgi:hypothetical protein
MRQEETDGVARGLKKFRPWLDAVVERRERPNGSGLRPDEFVTAQHLAIVAHAGEHASVLTIDAALKPKRRNAVKQEASILGAKLLLFFDC